MSKTIGILTGGGDCAGLNAVIASIVKMAIPRGHRCVGFLHGLNGLLDGRYRELTLDDVRGISHLGGTILYTVNKGRFSSKVGLSGERVIPREVLEEARRTIQEVGIDTLIIIGGDGTIGAAAQLSQFGVNVIGVPKTIDNDLEGTDRTFGYSTAVSIAVENIDRIHTTATSHERVFLVECMGREAGWIALESGLAGNANAILLPEFAVDVDELIGFLKKRLQTRGSAIVIVAEGIDVPKIHEAAYESDKTIQVAPRGASEALMAEIEKRAPGMFELRNAVLGHVQRGGSPNAEDRILAKRYGVAAFEACEQGRGGCMVRLHDNVIETIDIEEATGGFKSVKVDNPLYQAAKKLGVYINHP